MIMRPHKSYGKTIQLSWNSDRNSDICSKNQSKFVYCCPVASPSFTPAPRLYPVQVETTRALMWLMLLAITWIVICKTGYAESHKTQAVAYRTAAAILSLAPEEAAQGRFAEIRGVVTLSVEQGMVIHDSTAGIWIYSNLSGQYSAGDELEVQGTVTNGKFSPAIRATSVSKLGRSALPKPIRASFDDLSSGDLDDQYVTVIGSVRSVGYREGVPSSKSLFMKVEVDGKFLLITLPITERKTASALVDALIKFTGTAMCTKNDNRQIIAPALAVSSREDIEILRAPPSDPFSQPLISIGRLMQYRSGARLTRRVHVSGTVTYYQPGASLVLEDHGAALYLKTIQNTGLAVGDVVEAAGFPAAQNSGPILEDAVFRRISTGHTLEPAPVKLTDVSSGKLNYNLISTKGHLLQQMREPSRDVLLIGDGANMLLAEVDRPGPAGVLPKFPEGSVVQVAGISALQVDGPWNYGVESLKAVRCRILLRTPGDVSIIDPPSWWTLRHVLYIAVVLGILVLVFLAEIISSLVERWRLRAVLAERERLAHEIHDTLAQSFAGIGFQLQAIRRAIPNDLAQLQQQIDLARELVRHSHKEARRSIEPLHTDAPETADLLCSLEDSARKMIEGSRVELTVIRGETQRSLPLPILDAYLRIGQEAIANAIRHADPQHLTISLLYGADTVTLCIEDDGVGFIKSGDLLGFGLRGMRKRAANISASLDIESQPGKGTRIIVSSTLPRPATPSALLRSFWNYLSEHLFHAYDA